MMLGRIGLGRHSMQGQADASASIPNRLSRLLLAVEGILIVLPVAFLAVALAFLFFVFWLPLALASTVISSETDRFFVIALISLSALGSLAYLGNVAQLSIRYVFVGRPVLQSVSRFEWVLLLLGPLIPTAWAMAAWANYGSTSDTVFSAYSILFVPALLLVLPSFHLFLAKRIAEYRLRHA
jgi:hypothetical protein